MVRAYLYDADGVDRDVRLDGFDIEGLAAENSLLWVNIEGAVEDDVGAAGELLGLEPGTTAALVDGSSVPSLFVHQDYFHVTVMAVEGDEDGYRPVQLDCVAGHNWVLTSHGEPLGFVERFDDRFIGESNVGRFDSAALVSALLNEQLLSYGRQLDPIVNEIDGLEQAILRDRVDENKLIRQLVAINQRITRLRRWLAPHRDIYERLAQPSLSQLLPGASPEGLFAALISRLERTLDSIDTARQMVEGSLGLYTTLVAHGTNRVIKLLTVVSVTLLPPTLIAGVLGMNALPAGFKTTTSFWASIAVMLLLATTTLTFARRRHWI